MSRSIKNNPFEQLLNKAYRYLALKPRSIHEMTVYLQKKGGDPAGIETVINDLIAKKFLNDLDYGKWYIDNRIKFKPRSRFALEYELRQKGISSHICESILAPLDDHRLAFMTIQPRLSNWKGLNHDAFKKKVMNYLRYRGFSYTISHTVFKQIVEKKEDP